MAKAVLFFRGFSPCTTSTEDKWEAKNLSYSQRAGNVLCTNREKKTRERVTVDFYHTKAWERRKASILRRDSYQCQECRRYGRKRQATTVHHIQHLDEHPELALTPSNLISLCSQCHNKAHPEKGGSRK